jgi:hypothetical protein
MVLASSGWVGSSSLISERDALSLCHLPCPTLPLARWPPSQCSPTHARTHARARSLSQLPACHCRSAHAREACHARTRHAHRAHALRAPSPAANSRCSPSMGPARPDDGAKWCPTVACTVAYRLVYSRCPSRAYHHRACACAREQGKPLIPPLLVTLKSPPPSPSAIANTWRGWITTSTVPIALHKHGRKSLVAHRSQTRASSPRSSTPRARRSFVSSRATAKREKRAVSNTHIITSCPLMFPPVTPPPSPNVSVNDVLPSICSILYFYLQ